MMGNVLANQRTVGAPGDVDAVISYDPYDPDRQVEVVLAPLVRRRGVDRLRARPRSAWLWTAIVATTIGALLVGAARYPGSAAGGGGPAPGRPGSQLEPTWTPPDLALWDLSWRDSMEPTDSATDAGPPVAQLFGSKAGDRKLLVTVQPLVPTSEAPRPPAGAGRTPIAVRGVIGSIAHADGVTTVEWNEEDADVRADARGLGDDAALAAITSLRWRSAKTSEGFEPRSATRLDQLVPVQLAHAPRGTYGAAFRYARSAASADQLVVWTCPRGDSACGGYATTAFPGAIASDGSASYFDDHARVPGISASGAVSFEQEWPDGGSIVLVGSHGALPDASVARRIAASVRPRVTAHLKAERDELGTRFAALPLVAEANLSGGRVEVHAAGPTRALCLQPPRAQRVCLSRAGFGQDPAIDVAGALVDGNWWLMATTTHGPAKVTADLNVLVLEAEGLGKPLASDVRTIGGRTLLLAPIPEGVPGAVITDADHLIVLHSPTN
jgi:hypothetical protein